MRLISLLRHINEASRQGFELHPKLDPDNYKLTSSLKTAEKWKSKALIGSSPREGIEIGDWDQVVYVMIPKEGNHIVPVARSDAHHRGYQLLKSLGIPGGYFPISIGFNHIFSREEVEPFVEAAKKWRAWGGKDLAVEVHTNDGDRGALQMSDLIQHGAIVQHSQGELAPVGRRIVDAFKQLAQTLRQANQDQGMARRAVKEADYLMGLLIEAAPIGTGIVSYFDEAKDFRKSLRSYAKDPEALEMQIYGFGEGVLGIKNIIHNTIRQSLDDPKNWRAENATKVFGDLQKAEAELASI